MDILTLNLELVKEGFYDFFHQYNGRRNSYLSI
jgi:hypothetical protein